MVSNSQYTINVIKKGFHSTLIIMNECIYDYMYESQINFQYFLLCKSIDFTYAS